MNLVLAQDLFAPAVRHLPPLSPQESWLLSDGRQVLHSQPRRCDRWSQTLEVPLGELWSSPADR